MERSMKERLDISIFCLTYNHKKYIRDALNGFLTQKTNYSFQIAIFDDASNDGTSEILLEYKRKYPNKIRLFISPNNIYKSPNRDAIWDNWQRQNLLGKYIAICEGDDCWIDNNKLQMQVDFMEKHKECVMTAHGSIVQDFNTGELYKRNVYNENKYLLPQEIIMQPNGNLPTASLIIRRDAFFKPDIFPKCSVGDVPMQLFALTKGKIYYFERIMSVYRFMHQGSWTSNYSKDVKNAALHNIDFTVFLSKYNEYTNYEYNLYIKKMIKKYANATLGALGNCQDAYEKKEIISTIQNTDLDIFKELMRIYNNYFCNNSFSEMEIKTIQQYKYVYIMGKGKYSKVIQKCFLNNKLIFNGFLVTEKEDMDIDTYALKDYPYDKTVTLVVVGVDQKNEDDIRKNLNKYEFDNVLCPIWFKE